MHKFAYREVNDQTQKTLTHETILSLLGFLPWQLNENIWPIVIIIYFLNQKNYNLFSLRFKTSHFKIHLLGVTKVQFFRCWRTKD